jgi:hypothetical protein
MVGKNSGGLPPYLLKTADKPQGVDGGVFAGIEKAVAVDRYAFFSGFLQNFCNTGQILGEACQRTSDSGQVERRGECLRHRQPGMRRGLARRLPPASEFI